MAYLSHRSSSRGHGGGSTARELAYGLGWFSLALGAAGILAPRTMTRLLGMEGQERLVQAYGGREVATGIGILCSRDPAPWIWGRVAGDALDIATVATALRDDNPQRQNVGMAIAALAGVTAVDAMCAAALSAGYGEPEPAMPMRDYSDRSGFPSSPESMRGAARDAANPSDYRAPDALQPWKNGRPEAGGASSAATGASGMPRSGGSESAGSQPGGSHSSGSQAGSGGAPTI